MKEKISSLVDDSIKDLNVFVDDAFISEEEGKKIFNIVLDSDEVIDLNKVTDASRIINKITGKSFGVILSTKKPIIGGIKVEPT